jgi:competence protein ComEA
VATAAAVALALVLAVLLAGRRSSPPTPVVLPRAGDGGGQAATGGPGVTAGAGGEEDRATLTVHAAGAVSRPGIYVLPARARVADVLAAAGGPTADADVDQLNLATKVADGDRVYVPRRGEAVAPPASAGGGNGAGSSLPQAVDLNAATASQLEALPGIGPALAKAIVEHRTRHGRFRAVTDLLDVPGIGPAKLATLRPLVRV